ncbi:MAG: LysR family transcriptional regulator [Dethiobacteria bacterium]|jgi:LysR family transcriptional activator of glutamate synthase operon
MMLDYLLCFEAVIKYRNFTKAAESLHMSQSALSKKVKAMEDELGVTLFVRKHSTIELTPAGELVFKRIEKILNEYHQLVLDVKDYINSYGTKLRIASFYGMAHYGITDLIVSFEKVRDNFHVESRERNHEQMVHLLDTMQVDLVIGYQEFFPKNMDYYSVPLLKDDVVLVVNSSLPLAQHDAIYLKYVEDEKFCFPKEDASLFNFYCDTCRAAGFFPKLTLSDVRLDTIKCYISEGLRLTLQTRSCATNFFNEEMFHLINLKEAPSLTLAILIKALPKKGVVREFIDFAQSFYANHLEVLL